MPQSVDLFIENRTAVELWNRSNLLGANVLQVLDDWGETGDSRELLARKVEVLELESSKWEREQFEKRKRKSETK